MTSVLESSVAVDETSVSVHEVLRTSESWATSRSSVSSGDVWSVHSPLALWGGTRAWAPDFVRRLEALARLPRGWDSMAAEPLSSVAVGVMFQTLTRLDDYIQSAPAVSIRDDGGILCAWSNQFCSLDFDAPPGRPLGIYFQELTTQTEWEGELEGALNVEKWLWQASSPQS